MSQSPATLYSASPIPELAQAGLRECLLSEKIHCDLDFLYVFGLSDKIVDSAMPFSSWAGHPSPTKTPTSRPWEDWS